MLAAILTGALWMPVFVAVYQLIESVEESGWLLMIWLIIGFMIPLLAATGDFRYIREKGGFWRPMASKHDFREFYFPVWKRMLAVFVSTVVSLPVIGGLFKLLGWPDIFDAR
jgi:hypothetical protein